MRRRFVFLVVLLVLLLFGVSAHASLVGGGETQVVNEPHPAVAVPGSFTLLQQEPDPATIQVFVKYPVAPFEIIPLQEGVNYTVTPLNNTFQIEIINLPSQFLLPGSFDFFVSYSVINNCAATLSNDLTLTVPIVTYVGQAYWAVLQNVPQTETLTLTNAGVVADVSQFSACAPATLSPSLQVQIPVVIFNGVSYWADLQYSQGPIGVGMNLTLTGYGAVQNLAALIVGTWTLDANQTVWPGESTVGYTGTFVLNNDNTFNIVLYDNGVLDTNTSGTYSISGNVFTGNVTQSNHPSKIGTTVTGTITLSNNNNTLTLSSSDGGTNVYNLTIQP